MKKDNIDKQNLASFAKNPSRVWSSDRQVMGALGSGDGYRKTSRDKIVERLSKADTPEKQREISIEAKLNQGYTDVINYYKTMFYYRYTVTPIANKVESKGDLLALTKEMLNVVDGINIEAILPYIIEIGLFEGQAAVYVEKNKNTIVTHVLPNKYSKPLLRSNYGTDTVVFDLSYFDELLQRISSDTNSNVLKDTETKEKKKEREQEAAETRMAILSFFPKELVEHYKLYAGLDDKGRPVRGAAKGPKLVSLNPESAAIIPFSPTGAPPKINVTAAEENYKEMIEVQNKKSKASLEKIFTHQIPTGPDGDLLITVDEAAAIQRAMEQFVGENAEISVLTTIGPTFLHQVQKEDSVRSQMIEDAYDTQFESASINPQLFRADTDYALGVSLNRDAAFMWDIIKKIVNFYNLSVNKLFKFGDYTCNIEMLPITIYNEHERVENYRRNAEYGIGKLEAIIATGQRQVSLVDKLKLEELYQLDELLTPLQSSHTRSSKDQDKEKVKTATEADEPNEPENEKTEEVNNE